MSGFGSGGGYARTLLLFPPPPKEEEEERAPHPASPNTDPVAAAQPSVDLSSSAEASSACAGFALFYPTYSTWRGAPGIYLEDLFVRPAHRGRGYGKRLLAELARETRRIGGERLEWSVLRWNEPSIRFYEGLGATRLEEWVSMRVEGEGELGRLAEGAEGAEGGQV